MLALLTFMSISFRAQLRRHWTTLVLDTGGSLHWHLDPVEKMRWYPAVVASWEQNQSKGPWKNSAKFWLVLLSKKQPMNETYDVIVKLDDFPKFRGENKNYVKPPHSFILPILCDIHVQNISKSWFTFKMISYWRHEWLFCNVAHISACFVGPGKLHQPLGPVKTPFVETPWCTTDAWNPPQKKYNYTSCSS